MPKPYMGALADSRQWGYTYQTPRRKALKTILAERLPAATVVRPACFFPTPSIPATQPWLERLLSKGACKGRILLVDDISDVRQILQFYLERNGYYVRTGSNGVECLKMASTQRPDLILLNYLMPVMDGLKALRQLKMNPTISYLKVVMFSAVRDFEKFRATAMDDGAIDCLETPFDIKTLLSAVEKALRSR